MAESKLPTAMKAWQYTTASGGLENNLKLNSSTSIPAVKKADEHLVQILAMALNPVDYKPAEVAIVSRLTIPKPAIPGLDFVGRVVKPAAQSSVKEGQLVFGMAGTGVLAGAALADYAVVSTRGSIVVPEGLAPGDAAGIGVAGLTAYQSIMPYIKPGSRVFINGGSGGTGVFGIQIAKLAGLHVTTCCSTANVELCKSLGADEVIDYKKESVLEALKKQKAVDHIVDNVGSNYDLFWKAHEYSVPGTRYVYVGGTPSLSFLSFALKAKFWPGFLGGGKRAYQGIFAQPHLDELEKIGSWMAEGKVKSVIDETFPFDKAPEAYRKLKTGRAKGKIVVDVGL